ncbi:MAG: prolyl oligopeptidase family serine peptidase [Gemmatimonadetes bacterium]|nr:prolyl oligopeptidase family serine peptidase [Gemmatimonadota bacterium]
MLSRAPRRRRLPSLSAVILVALAPFMVPVSVQAQSATEKRTLEIADYAQWRTISGSKISDDGRWVAWAYSRVRGDDTLHVEALDSDAAHVIASASDPELSDDGAWIAYFIAPPFLEAEKLLREGETVTRQAGLLELATGASFTWDDASSFGFSEGSSHFFVKKRKTNEEAEHDGTDLILRNLREGFEELIGSVGEAEFNDGGTHLAFTVDAEDKDGNGLYLVDLATGSRRGLDNAKERYARLTWSEEGDALAVLRGEKPEQKVERENVLIAFRHVANRPPTRIDIDATGNGGLGDGVVLSEKGSLVWNEDATMLFVATKRQDDELEDWPEDDLPLADVNIWHWADDRIQSQQEQAASRDRDRTYVAAVNLERGTVVPLADERMRTVEITRDGRWAIGRDETAYISDWRPELADLYRLDLRTGERVTVLEGQLRTLGLSPDSRHYLYWKDGDFWDYRIVDDEHVNLTGSAPVDFTNQEYDRFGEKPPHGVAGWTADGDGVVLYDRYDIWLQPLDGSSATNLTGGRGAADEMRLRYIRTDPDARTIDLGEPLLIDAYGQWTKKEGFFELDGDDLEQLTWEDRRFDTPRKAADAERYLFTAQTFQEYPDLYVSGNDFADRTRVTDANPQQDEFLWGHRILFDYTNDDGVPLQGTLAIPDDYEPGQKLPMLVRFYEKYSQDLHLYPTPTFRHSPNFAGYVSNGYLVMQPDVHFRIGSSHSDMLESVEAAVRKVIEMGYADPDALGLSGHSYSGGGSAYIATRSEMFSAIAHGAAPINLVSEFNQLFVGSGRNNHSYDIYGQGRYATNPYDDFQRYWDQSPISGVQSMDTPVLYLHGEADPTVNWEQGLEWYNALRFLGKPIIWLSYPDEGHGLRKLQNRVDFQHRLRQFFEHHLKGEPAAGWMTDGVPYLDKERRMREFAPRIFRSDSTRIISEPQEPQGPHERQGPQGPQGPKGPKRHTQ